MSFFIQDLQLNFHSFLGFQHGSGLSIKAIMPLSATLPLAIGLNFLVCNSIFISKVSHTWISFLNPKDQSNPTKPVFERILTKALFQYTLNLVSKKKLGSFNYWINAYFQSFIYVFCPTIWIFSDQHLFKSFLGVSKQNSANLGIT